GLLPRAATDDCVVGWWQHAGDVGYAIVIHMAGLSAIAGAGLVLHYAFPDRVLRQLRYFSARSVADTGAVGCFAGRRGCYRPVFRILEVVAYRRTRLDRRYLYLGGAGHARGRADIHSVLRSYGFRHTVCI